jgi:hypothetical protein
MSELRISDDLALPIDAVTQSMAILARRGAGKTYTGSVIVEEAIGAKVPTVVLDPTGAWWGLRSSIDGERPGLPVVIFGGDHGDVPLEPTAGTVLADVVIEHPGAYVIDLSGLLSKAAEQRFAADFLERLYRAKKRETGPLLVVVDEADTFAPQRPGPEQTRTLGALESIVRRGRIKGLGDLLITQRAAVLNKNVLTQTEILVAMQTTGPQDRAAIDAWIEGNGTAEQRAEVMGSLASLERGEAWVWSPSFLRILQRVRIRARRTFDSSRTPEAGETALAPRAFAAVDLAKLGARIAATIEKQKANDPRELRRRFAELERQMAKSSGHPDNIPEPRIIEKIVEVPVLNGQVDELRDVVRELAGIGERITAAAGGITAAIDRVQVSAREQHGRSVRGSSRTETEVRALPPAPRSGVRSDVIPIAQGEVHLKAGARRILEALARHHPMVFTRAQVGTLTGFKISGGRSAHWSVLKRAGYIEERGDQVGATQAGLDVAGVAPSTPATTEEMLELWRSRLKSGARQMLDVLVAAYPDAISLDTLAEAVAMVRSGGTFGTYISTLRRNGLAETSDGTIRASDSLFIGGAR